MVNFNNESTVGTPAVDVVRILMLQSRQYCFDAWEDYHKRQAQGADVGLDVVFARLHTWFLMCQSALKRRLEDQQYNQLKTKLTNKDNETDLMDVTVFLNDYLDQIKLTMLDTKKEYDKTDWESENTNAGL